MIQLSRADCKQVAVVAEHLKAKAERLDERTSKALHDVADQAKRVAEAGYALGLEYGVTPSSIPKVYIDQDKENYGDTWFVIANGKGVMFLEFGAGIAADSLHKWVMEVPFSVAPGSWSKDHARQFSDNGYWFYNGTSYAFIPATRAMYNAYLDAKQKIESGEWLKDDGGNTA